MNVQIHSAEALNYFICCVMRLAAYFFGSVKVLVLTLTQNAKMYINIKLFRIMQTSLKIYTGASLSGYQCTVHLHRRLQRNAEFRLRRT
jgi:hypothetical protein